MDFTYDSNGAAGFNYLTVRLATRVYSVWQQPNAGGATLRTNLTDMDAVAGQDVGV